MRLCTLSSTLSFGVLGILTSVVLLAQGQSERPQFRAGVELLQLDVVVLDNKRQPVRGLTAADFTVLDNGVATPIRAFTPIELAQPRTSEAAWAGDVAPDVVTNQVGEEDGRLVVILMDRTIPIEQPTVTARKIATTAVESLGPYRSGRRRLHEQQRRPDPRRSEPDRGPRPAAGRHQRGRSEHRDVWNSRGDHEHAGEPVHNRPA